jgi:serine acetyltransferase
MPLRMLRSFLPALRRDAERYEDLGGWFKNPGFWIGATHRFGALARSISTPVVRWPLLSQHVVLDAVCRLVFNVNISTGARIGPGLCLIHARNIMVGPSKIGRDCLIFHEVTIGTNAGAAGPIVPTIGDNVDIYVGARVLGKLLVEDDAKIGANCVVTKNVRRGSVVVPAEIREVPAALVKAFGPRRAVPKPAASVIDETDATEPPKTSKGSSS